MNCSQKLASIYIISFVINLYLILLIGVQNIWCNWTKVLVAGIQTACAATPFHIHFEDIPQKKRKHDMPICQQREAKEDYIKIWI